MPGIPIRTAAVFCGSRPGVDPLYVAHAQTLGRLLALRGIGIVYGGGGRGMMGAVADAHLAAGGRVTGIIPRLLADVEHQHTGLSELVVTADMHERKRMMYERCDAAIILPGGFGTLDELFEMLTWNQLSIHDKRISVLDTGGFYTHLMEHLRHLERTGFLYDRVGDRIGCHGTPEALVDALTSP
jgi:uncharacterized protein (TIGR00730 family)